MLIDLLLGSYSRLFFDIDFPNYYTRNFLFEGIPYFLGGFLFKKYEKKFKCKHRIVPLFVLMLGFVITFIEVTVLSTMNLMTDRFNFIGTIIMTFSFMLVAKNMQITKRCLVDMTRLAASKYILPIYLFHPFSMLLLNKSFVSYTKGYNYMLPLYSILLVVLLVSIFEYITKRSFRNG